MHRWVLLSTMILVALAATLRGEPWYRLYDDARGDISHQRWESAIYRLEKAVAQRPESGPAVRTDGTKKIAYFPYFLMGKAHYHLGLFDEAAKYFDQETRVGLPARIATEIDIYKAYLRAIDDDRIRLAQFNQVVQQAKTLRARGAFVEAADALRRAQQYHPAEFDRLELGQTIDRLLSSERTRIEERARREQAARSLALVTSAQQAKQGSRSRNQRPVQAVSALDPEAVRRAVLSAYEGSPEQAVKMLEQLQPNGPTRNAELESATGIAYARLSFLTVNPSESERFRDKATQHFRLALALDPRHKLDSRLVAPQIIDLFAASR